MAALADYLGNGVYRIGKAERIWSCRKAVMDDAVAEVEPGIPPADARFGWFKGAIPTPPNGGFYVVEFLDDQKVRVFAYVDMYGRAFTTETGFERPPAKSQDMFIAFAEGSSSEGTIFVQGADGAPVACAPITKSGSGQNAKYTIGESWYDFKGRGSRLHYYDLMTRAYLAFVYRPTLGKATLPFGVADVYRTLAQNEVLPALNEIIARVEKAANDHLITVHPVVGKLSERLVSAGVPAIADDAEAGMLRLSRTGNYADTFYLQAAEGSAALSEASIWEIEAAINLFSLAESLLEVLQSKGELASLAGCETYLLETAASQTAGLELASGMPEGASAGEWQTRSRIAAGIENMALPLRVEATFMLDLAQGVVKFDMRVPGAGIFEALFGGSAESAANASMRYAMQAALLLADIAMRASERIERVGLLAHTVDRKDGDAELFRVCIDRELYGQYRGFEQERKGDPLHVFEVLGRRSCDKVAPEAPQAAQSDSNTVLSPEAQAALCAKAPSDMEVHFDAGLRSVAEGIADAISAAEDVTDAVAIARRIQAETLSADGDACAVESSARISAAFDRLLKALAEGMVDLHEQNSTVNCFLEEDMCMRAYQRSRELSEKGELNKAIGVLSAAITEVEASGFFADSGSTVYRVFDSYASRLVYNRVKAHEMPVFAECTILEDAGKETQLAPDGYAFCLFEVASLLLATGRGDDAELHAGKAIRIAPTMSAGYRVLAHIFAQRDDLANARAILVRALSLMAAPDDIAALYYHLAYLLWKSGDPEIGFACYIKSLQTSSITAEACISEMEELQKETSLPVPSNDDIDPLLEKAGVPLAPTDDVRAAIENGAVAALDEGLFDIARSLLTFAFHYRKDDAIVGVIRSLTPSFQDIGML